LHKSKKLKKKKQEEGKEGEEGQDNPLEDWMKGRGYVNVILVK